MLIFDFDFCCFMKGYMLYNLILKRKNWLIFWNIKVKINNYIDKILGYYNVILLYED